MTLAVDERLRHEPEWTAENMNRKRGDTTFKTCGWCEHRGGGTCRYNCLLDGACSLMKDYGDDRNVKWDTPCKIVQLGKADLDDLISSKQRAIKESLAAITDAKQKIKALQQLKRKAPYIPPSPGARDYDHFNLKDRIYVFLDKVKDKPVNEWAIGTVVPGYRHHDGCVSYVLDNYPESQKGWGCGTGVPCVLLKKEFDYFKKHPGMFKLWLKRADKSYNGSRLPIPEYIKAFEKA